VGRPWASVNYWLLAASLVPARSSFCVLRAVRWRQLFYPLTGLRLSAICCAVICIGYLLSNVFPARLGDVARAYLIGDTEEVSRTTAFSTVVAERVLDALAAVGRLLPGDAADKHRQVVLRPTARVDGALRADRLARRPWWLSSVFVAAGAASQRVDPGAARAAFSRYCTGPSRQPVRRFGERMAAAKTRLRFLATASLAWAGAPGWASVPDSLIDGLAGITTLRLGPALLVIESALIWIGHQQLLLAGHCSPSNPTSPSSPRLAVDLDHGPGHDHPNSSPGYIGVFELLGTGDAWCSLAWRPSER
jgi:hypothetical protein